MTEQITEYYSVALNEPPRIAFQIKGSERKPPFFISINQVQAVTSVVLHLLGVHRARGRYWTIFILKDALSVRDEIGQTFFVRLVIILRIRYKDRNKK